MLGFVAFAKTHQIGRQHARTGGAPDRDHFAVKVAPGQAAVQTQPGRTLLPGALAPPLVQVVHAKTPQGRQIAAVVAAPGVVGHSGKAAFGGAQRVVAQRLREGALLRAALAKEIAQQAGAFGLQQTALQQRVVVELALRKQVEHRSGSAGFGVGGAENHTPQARVQHGTAAHGAGLEGDEQFAVVEPVVSQRLRCRPQRLHLGVRGRVVPAPRGVVAGADHPALMHHHRTHRHLTQRRTQPGLRQRQPHEIGVTLGWRLRHSHRPSLADWRAAAPAPEWAPWRSSSSTSSSRTGQTIEASLRLAAPTPPAHSDGSASKPRCG